MRITLIATALIAALLLTGTAAFALPQREEYGAQTPTTDPAIPTLLTEQEAIAIALQHAELTEDVLTLLHGKLDRDEEIPEWEIEWRYGDWEYDYTIHAYTGAIMEWDKEYDPIRQNVTPTEPVISTEPTPEEPAPTQPEPTEPEPVPTEAEAVPLTAMEAVKLALEHAGLSEDQVVKLEAELEKRRDVTYWEVEWEIRDWEYEYHIDYYTGQILFSDKEQDD